MVGKGGHQYDEGNAAEYLYNDTWRSILLPTYDIIILVLFWFELVEAEWRIYASGTIIGSENDLSPDRHQRVIGPFRTNVMKFNSKCIHFHQRKSIWKCRLTNGGYYVSASICSPNQIANKYFNGEFIPPLLVSLEMGHGLRHFMASNHLWCLVMILELSLHQH